MTARATPRLSIEMACRRLGQREVIERCRTLVAGGDVDPEFLVTLGGPAAVRLLNDGIPTGQRYWLRVLGARGLLWAGPGADVELLRAALSDDHWRVREMTCKVIARHCVGDLLDDVAELEADPVARVRAAAARAAARIVEVGA